MRCASSACRKDSDGKTDPFLRGAITEKDRGLHVGIRGDACYHMEANRKEVKSVEFQFAVDIEAHVRYINSRPSIECQQDANCNGLLKKKKRVELHSADDLHEIMNGSEEVGVYEK